LAPWGIICICVIICNVGKINIVLETYMNEGYGIWYHNGWIGIDVDLVVIIDNVEVCILCDGVD
jgi:hypothetical protein